MLNCRWVAREKRKLFFILLGIVLVEIVLVCYIVSAEHSRSVFRVQ